MRAHSGIAVRVAIAVVGGLFFLGGGFDDGILPAEVGQEAALEGFS